MDAPIFFSRLSIFPTSALISSKSFACSLEFFLEFLDLRECLLQFFLVRAHLVLLATNMLENQMCVVMIDLKKVMTRNMELEEELRST